MERRELENAMRFEEGVKKIHDKLVECSAFEDSIIGHVSHEIKAAMLEALDVSDEDELIDALVSICINAMEQPQPPTMGELLRTQFRLYDEITALKEEKRQLQEIINVLQLQNKQLTEQMSKKSAALETLKAANKQRTIVQSGQPISYKEEIEAEAVLKLLRKGMSIQKIADHFGVSRNLIYRRINELKEAGIDVDTLRKKK